jgi:hypothetical protein
MSKSGCAYKGLPLESTDWSSGEPKIFVADFEIYLRSQAQILAESVVREVMLKRAATLCPLSLIVSTSAT